MVFNKIVDSVIGMVLIAGVSTAAVPIGLTFIANLSLLPDNPLAALFTKTFFGIIIFAAVFSALLTAARKIGGRGK